MRKITLFILLMFIISCGKEEVSDNDNSQNPTDGNEPGNNNPGNTGVSDFYRFTTYQTSTADPYDVNILFHVSDTLYRGVPNLKVEDLRITENDEESPIDESKATLFDRNSFELKMRTALLIDVSNSIQADFEVLKDELKLLINAALPFQEIAIYTFSSTTELVQDYSTDVDQLENAIDNLELGTSSTDFYGAVVAAANSFTNGFVENEVTIGNLIIITDGDDTQASNTFSAATEALINKNAYVVGLSSADLNEDNIKNLFGNSFYFASETIGSVNENFGLVQSEIENFANSIYLLNYETPKRGNSDHFLKVYHKENINEGDDQYAVGEFTSSGFYEPVSPTAATLWSPAQNEEIILTNYCSVTFEVGKSTDENLTASDEITYEFYFGNSETTLELIDSKTVSVTQSQISFESPSGLSINSSYFWQVKTKDDDFEELDILSDIKSFVFANAIYLGDFRPTSALEIEGFCYTEIQGDIDIDGCILSDINIDALSFPNLEIAKNIVIHYLPHNQIKGFENLMTARDIQIIANSGVTEVSGFNRLVTAVKVEFTANNILQKISGFNSLNDSNSNIIFDRNINLTEINGFNEAKNLNTVIISNIGAELKYSLKQLNAFKKLQTLNSLHILTTGLSSVSLSNLESVNNINIRNNIELESLSFLGVKGGLLFRRLSIISNPKLIDFCHLIPLSEDLDFQFLRSNYQVNLNQYNPTLDDLINGTCKQ